MKHSKLLLAAIAALSCLFFVNSCDKDTSTNNDGGSSSKSSFKAEAVDLGLSVKWASQNVGASEPYKEGDYFTFDEAQNAVSGSKWSVPSQSECQELCERCTFEESELNGIRGTKVTGPSGKSIFFPSKYYWTKTPVYTTDAYILSFPYRSASVVFKDRAEEFPVRPVCD